MTNPPSECCEKCDCKNCRSVGPRPHCRVPLCPCHTLQESQKQGCSNCTNIPGKVVQLDKYRRCPECGRDYGSAVLPFRATPENQEKGCNCANFTDSFGKTFHNEKCALIVEYPKTPEAVEECPRSERVDGKKHSFVFDGDDPYVVCAFCGEIRDAITGRILTALTATPTPKSVEETAQAILDRFFDTGARVKKADWDFLVAKLTPLVAQKEAVQSPGVYLEASYWQDRLKVDYIKACKIVAALKLIETEPLYVAEHDHPPTVETRTPAVEVGEWEKEFKQNFVSGVTGALKVGRSFSAQTDKVLAFIRKLQAATAASEREAGRREALAEVEEILNGLTFHSALKIPELLEAAKIGWTRAIVAALKEISHEQEIR